MKKISCLLAVLLWAPIVASAEDNVSISTYTAGGPVYYLNPGPAAPEASIDISTSADGTAQTIITSTIGTTGFTIVKNAIPIGVYDLTDEKWKYGAVSDLYVLPPFPYLTFVYGGVKDVSDKDAMFTYGAVLKIGSYVMSTSAGSTIRSIIPTVVADGALGNTVIGYLASFSSEDKKLHHSIFGGVNIRIGSTD